MGRGSLLCNFQILSRRKASRRVSLQPPHGLQVCALQHTVIRKGVNYRSFKYNVSLTGFVAFPEHLVHSYKQLCFLIKDMRHYDTAIFSTLLLYNQIDSLKILTVRDSAKCFIGHFHIVLREIIKNNL